MPSLRAFRGEFPSQQNRELFRRNRDSRVANREFYCPQCDRQETRESA